MPKNSLTPSYAPLIVIPVYNNRETVVKVIRSAAQHGLPILVVDDGSHDGTAEALRAASQGPTLINFDTFTLARNQGKGAALKAAFHWALGQGYTHAVTMDADGQHDASDIPGLVAASQATPQAIILGYRDFTGQDAANIPFSSRFGRGMSNFWLWVETGLRLPDTQTGFRVYPLQHLPLSQLHRRHYDFEIEVLVKAWRRGVDLQSHGVRVHYPPRAARVSHFHAVRDNIRLSSLHARFTISLLWRGHWRRQLAPLNGSRERRGASVLPFFMRHMPLGLCYSVMPVILFFYFITGGPARRTIMAFYRRLGVRSGVACWYAAFQNYLYFAASLLDRVALTVGAWDGRQAVMASRPPAIPQDCIMVGAHYGDQFFSALTFVHKQGAAVAVVMDRSVNPVFHSVVEKVQGAHVVILDSRNADLGFVLRLKELADQGYCLCFLADRPGTQGSSLGVHFMGEGVPFAALPFKLAETLGRPIYAFFCTKTRWWARAPFRFDVMRLDEPGKRQASQLAQAFANALETQVRRAPQHWFNFAPLSRSPQQSLHLGTAVTATNASWPASNTKQP